MAKRIVLEELARIQEQVNTLFEQALLSSNSPAAAEDGPQAPGVWTPAVDVVETSDAFLVYAELPGVAREDLRLEVHERELELSGTRRGLSPGESFLRLERSYGSFRRVFLLPEAVVGAGIEATLVDGVLAIRLPKRPAAQTMVPIQQSEG